jgi:hypothetical protein
VGSPTYIALDVLLDDGTQQVFWHHELEEITSPKAWWRLLLGGGSAG